MMANSSDTLKIHEDFSSYKKGRCNINWRSKDGSPNAPFQLDIELIFQAGSFKDSLNELCAEIVKAAGERCMESALIEIIAC